MIIQKSKKKKYKDKLDKNLIILGGYNEGSGTIVRNLSKPSIATTNTDCTYSTDTIGSGYAFSYNGTSSKINYTYTQSGIYSVSLWVKTSDILQDSLTGVFSSADSSSNGTFQIDFDSSTPRKYRFLGKNSVGDAYGYLFGEVLEDTYQHIVVTWDLSTLKGYLNGVEVFSESVSTGDSGVFTNPNTGSNRIFANYFTGLIDEIRVYNKVLNTTEIARLYNAK